MVPRLRIELNNFSYTGINVSKLAFIISFLILSENGEILFFNFSAAWGISLLVIMKYKDESVDHDLHFLVAHCNSIAELG